MARKRTPETDEDEDDSVVIVDERTEAVQAAAAARLEGPESVAGADDDVAFDGLAAGDALIASAAEEVAAAQETEGLADPNEGEGVEGDPVDQAAHFKDGQYDWFLGGGDDDEPPEGPWGLGKNAPKPGETSASVEGAGGSAQSVTVEGGTAPTGNETDTFGRPVDLGFRPEFNPLETSTTSSPLTSAANAMNAATGSNTASDGAEVDDAPAFGQGMIAADPAGTFGGRVGWHNAEQGPFTSGPASYRYVGENIEWIESVTTTRKNTVEKVEGHHSISPSGEMTLLESRITETNIKSGAITTTTKDFVEGTKTVTTNTKAGETTVVTPLPPSEGGPVGEPGVLDPGPDGDDTPLPEAFKRLLNLDVQLPQGGDGGGDGATDPSRIETADGPLTEALDDAAFGKGMLVNPGTPEAGIGGGPPAPNPGADSQGAGVIRMGDDQAMNVGSGRNDSPFDDAERPIENAADADETETDDDGPTVFLHADITGPVDSPVADIPDDLVIVDVDD